MEQEKNICGGVKTKRLQAIRCSARFPETNEETVTNWYLYIR